MEVDENLDDYQSESEVETILKAVVDIIDRLYKLATKIRNPKMRLTASKVVTFKRVDEDTGIDLIQEFSKADTRHIEELFWDYRLNDLKDAELESEERKDRARRPRELTETDHVMISRLVRANTCRRQQFGYWSRHRSKNTKETARALETRDRPGERIDESRLMAERKTPVTGQSSKTISRPSTATYLHDPRTIGINDNESTVSTRTFVPNAQRVQDEQVNVPQPPESLKGTKHILCPYCFTICSQSLLEKEAWR